MKNTAYLAFGTMLSVPNISGYPRLPRRDSNTQPSHLEADALALRDRVDWFVWTAL